MVSNASQRKLPIAWPASIPCPAAILIALVLLLASGGSTALAGDKDMGHGDDHTYTNPLSLTTPSGMRVESCADPTVIYAGQPGAGQTGAGQTGEHAWYMACTTDPFSGSDRDAAGNLVFHLIPIFRSTDLVNWSYVGDAFATRPAWVAPTAGLWAPDFEYFNGQYYLYFTAQDTVAGGSAIGVATSNSPAGPWTERGAPIIEPHAAPCCAGSPRWSFDPDVIADDSGQLYMFYGSYFGGISARKLAADGLTSDPASEVQITIPNRYEGAFILRHEGYYYLFGSATNCCNGPLTGYSVFAGRSQNLLGPYVDAQGVSLLAGRVGGTPVISMNGNRWVGPGHNTVVTDLAGQEWFVYHAVDRYDPYFAGAVGFTKRPALMDALDWVNGWPTVRNGRWASSTPQPAPATNPGDRPRRPARPLQADAPGKQYGDLSDEFNGSALGAQWTWVRPPDPATFNVSGGAFNFQTQAGDLYVDSNNASVLLEPTPKHDYLVETRVKLNLPPEGCCYNYVQAGLVIYGGGTVWSNGGNPAATPNTVSPDEADAPGVAEAVENANAVGSDGTAVGINGAAGDRGKPGAQGTPVNGDDNFIKLTSVSIWETRQTEYAKELSPVPEGYPRYGNTVIGAPDEWTYLRIARRACGSEECYTGYTSRDGVTWVRGGTWTHKLGDGARIGLVAMGGTGFTASFDYVRVYRLKPGQDDRGDHN